MQNLTLRLLLFHALCFLSSSLFAQKHFQLTVKLPQAINPKKIEVWLDNGKEAKKLNPQSITEKEMVLTGDYYSMYAVISLQYPPDSAAKGFAKEFFIGEKPGTITFNESSAIDSPFANFSLQNVLDFEKEKKQMDDYCAAERRKALDYEKQYGDEIFSGNDTAIRNHYFKGLMPELRRKKLQYITDHPQSYYSFYVFRTEVAKPTITSWDSLLLVFNSFPDIFKYSDEGNYLNAFLHGRLPHQRGNAIDFVAKDIHGKTVSLTHFKGRKYVLLHFWATWCTPCMRELPAINEINTQYSSKDLQIISIAVKSNDADYKKAINKYGMDWIHIYNNVDLLNKYGNMPTPRICLIDKTGKLVYDNIGLGINDDVQLSELNQLLKERIN